MSTMSLDVAAVRPRHLLPWATMIAGLVTGVVIGVLTPKPFFATATDPKANVNVSLSQPVAAAEPATFEIVPAPVIDTNRRFFFGAGDGSNGYYSERPMQ